MHGPQYLSVMKAKIQFLDFRYWQFELTCWSAYSNHTKGSLCNYIFDLFLTRELYISLPTTNSHCSTSPASHSNNPWSVISFITSAGNLWASQAVLDIYCCSPKFSSSSSCTIHLVCTIKQTNVK